MKLTALSTLLFTGAATFAACSDDGGSGQVTPEGEKYQYVVSAAVIPSTATQAKEKGLDLDGDGKVDNQLGQTLATLKSQNIDTQTSVTASINDGSMVLLAELQTKSFTSASATGLKIFLGDKATVMPAPCTDPAMATTCGQHLKGTGMFTVAGTSPKDVLVSGPIVGGTFKGGPGKISLSIALTAGQPIQLDLLGARAQLKGMSETGVTDGILAGAIAKSDLDTKIIPAIKVQLDGTIAEDCPNGTPANDCNCMADSGGKQILGLFDSAPKDCKVSVEEIQNNSIIKAFLAPDVVIDGVDALSLGIGVTMAKGTFTAP